MTGMVVNSIDSKDQYKFPYQHLCIFTKKGTITRTSEWLQHILVYKLQIVTPQIGADGDHLVVARDGEVLVLFEGMPGHVTPYRWFVGECKAAHGRPAWPPCICTGSVFTREPACKCESF